MDILKQLEGKISQDLEDKWWKKFERQACFLGNGIYTVGDTKLYSKDTRELFLMFVAQQEGIKYK